MWLECKINDNLIKIFNHHKKDRMHMTWKQKTIGDGRIKSEIEGWRKEWEKINKNKLQVKIS